MRHAHGESVQAILGHVWLLFLDFRLISDAAVQGHWSGVTGAAPRRLNVGNMLDVDRYPKCCFNMFNMFNIFGEPELPFGTFLSPYSESASCGKGRNEQSPETVPPARVGSAGKRHVILASG